MSEFQPNHAITWLYTNKLEVMIDFYASILGLPQVMQTARCRVFRVSGSALVGVCQNPNRPLGVLGMMVTFVVDDVVASHAALKEKGVIFDAPPTIGDDASYAFFKDPQGYSLEIQQFAPGALDRDKSAFLTGP